MKNLRLFVAACCIFMSFDVFGMTPDNTECREAVEMAAYYTGRARTYLDQNNLEMAAAMIKESERQLAIASVVCN